LELTLRYAAGDDSAATALYGRYTARLQAFARSRCGRRFACRFDPDDVVQAAFRDLFRRLRQDPGGVGEIWPFLTALALNKVRTLVEHHSAAKRSVRRTSYGDHDPCALSVADGYAGVEEYEIRELLDSLPEEDRCVVRMRLEGFEVEEIAKKTGRSRRTVERVLHSLRERLAPSHC
jgi:RNA polymerase sigma factor (sigma-70 family)